MKALGVVGIVLAGLVLACSSACAGDEPFSARFFDAEDGWLDVGQFLDTAAGFLPIGRPITEPAIGYGAALGVAFIKRNTDWIEGEQPRPDIAGVGVLATDNGSFGGAVGYSAWWLDGRLQTLAGAGYASINLDFFGLGGDTVLRDHPAHYEFEAIAAFLEANARIGRTPFFAGLRYAFADITVRFEKRALPRGVSRDELSDRVAGLTPILKYDARNNLFTPTRGLYAGVEVGVYNPAFGATVDYQVVNATAMYFVPALPTLFLGAKLDAALSFGEAPFYARPFVNLRGVQAVAYQGEYVTSLELEARWQFWRRFSLVAFAGAGGAFNDFARFKSATAVASGGAGARYELSRRHGLHMGLDVGIGPGGQPILYVIFGNAWFRP
jgi:hypothetical protein